MDDTITTLLRGVADGSIAVDDARTALEGAELTEEEMADASTTACLTSLNPAQSSALRSLHPGRPTSPCSSSHGACFGYATGAFR